MILEPPKIKSDTVSPSISHEMMGPDAMTFVQPAHSEGDQPWDFFGRNDAKAETSVLCHLMQRVDSLEKTLMLVGIGGRSRRGR